MTALLLLPSAFAAPLLLAPPDPELAGRLNTFVVNGATPGETVTLLEAKDLAPAPLPACPGVDSDVTDVRPRTPAATADTAGVAEIVLPIRAGQQGKRWHYQAVQEATCSLSDVETVHWPVGMAPVAIDTTCELDQHDAFLRAGRTALRMVAVYGDLTQPIDVTVDLEHDVALVLTSHTPSDWVVTDTGVGDVVEIVVVSQRPQTVTAPPGVPVTELDHAAHHTWAHEDTRAAIDLVEQHTGLTLTSWAGCYRSERFRLSEGASPPVPRVEPPCQGPGTPFGPPDTTLPETRCPGVTAQSGYCLGFDSGPGEIIAVGLDDGQRCVVTPMSTSPGPHSFAWFDDDVYHCAGSTLTRVSLVDGATEGTSLLCEEGVAALHDKLLVTPDSYMGNLGSWLFDSFEDIVCERDAHASPVDTDIYRVTTRGDLVVTGYHATDHVDLYDARTGTHIREQPLRGFDAWIFGLSIIGHDRLVVSTNDDGDDMLLVYSLSTGLLRRWIPLTGRIAGLHCVTP